MDSPELVQQFRVITEDAVLMPPGAGIIGGRPAIQKWFEENEQKTSVDLVWQPGLFPEEALRPTILTEVVNADLDPTICWAYYPETTIIKSLAALEVSR